MTATIPRIAVRNLQRRVPVDVVDLEKFGAKAVKLCLRWRKNRDTDLVRAREVSVFIISDWKMTGLHRQFMNEAGPTDVITFQHGEIFISADTAVRNAQRFGNSLPSELRLYIVHGLLHLHGFDDREKAGARKMEKIQRKILAEAKV